MTDFVKYLEGVKAKMGITSDRQLAMKIGVSPAYFSNIRLGQVPHDDICLKIAELTGDNPEYVILLAHKSKANEATRPYWDHIFKVFEAIQKPALAASLALFLALPFIAQGSLPFHGLTQDILCQLCFLSFFACYLSSLFKNTIISNNYKEAL